MAKRKRLDPAALAAERPVVEPRAAGVPPAAMPPIARVAGESAGGGERALAMAEEAGRLIHAIPLQRIEAGNLRRDRLSASEEEMGALEASILSHGQRMPIEVMPIEGGAHPFGLISGWRRLSALRQLAARHPGDERFATVKAFIRRPRDLQQAYVAMVEENEIREDISQFERARVAVLAVEAGAFESVEQAVDVLYGAGSKSRRSKIRSFVSVYQALGSALSYPQMIGERLGLRLAEALKAGQGAQILAALQDAQCEDAAAEGAILETVLRPVSRAKPSAKKPAKVSRAKPLFEYSLPGGAVVELHREQGVSRLEITGHTLTPHQAQILAGALEMLLEE